MRALSIFVATLAVTLAACDGSSDSKGTISTKTNTNGRNLTTGECTNKAGSVATTTCTGEDAYMTCTQASCGTQLKACLGAGYASGNFTGGACADFMACQMACPCDATADTCETTCAMKMMNNASCLTCMTTMGACIQGAGCVQPVCTDTTATSTATNTATNTSTTPTNTTTVTSTTTATNTATTGASCAKVTSCCATLTAGANAAQYQALCATLTSAGEAACAQILASWQTGGICK